MEIVFILLPYASAGIIVYALYLFSFCDPVFVEYVYSRGIYPAISRLSLLTANLPCSFAEILAYAILAFLLVYVVLMIKAACRRDKKRLKTVLFRLVILAVIFSNLYASFIVGWSLNYARQPLATSLGLNASPASENELYLLCKNLAVKANCLRTQTAQDEHGVFKMNQSKQEIDLEVKKAFQNNAPPFMNLGGETNVKGVLSFNLLSSLNIQGIFIPLTYEPNVNMQMPDLYFASSALHEYAHFKGFAREDEANFIAYYVARNMPDTDFSYSATMLALVNSLNQLAACNPYLQNKIYYSLSDAVIRDLSYNNSYWLQFKDSQKTIETINNNYLKSNNQSDGVQSYGRMVDLLIALQRSGNL